MDPYFDTNFIEWFGVLFSRLGAIVCGKELYPDEIQLAVMGLFAIGASFLGVLLVLKRLTMMANALSHTMLLGIVIALLLTTTQSMVKPPSALVIVIASLLVGLLTSVLTERLASVQYIKEDASNGMVFSALFALGVTILSVWSRNAHAGPELLMGDADALQTEDIPIVFWTTLVTLATGIIFLRGFALSIFDPSFASLAGFRPALLTNMMLALSALTTVSAFRAVGFIMTLSFFVLPALTARLWKGELRAILCLAIGIGVTTAVISIALARHLFTTLGLPVSTGALTATILAAAYGISVAWKARRVSRAVSIKCLSRSS